MKKCLLIATTIIFAACTPNDDGGDPPVEPPVSTGITAPTIINATVKAVYEHEASVWDLFVQNNFLQTIDNNIIKNYIGEGPKTQELGEASPGNIGSFAGWQIVKKFMQKNPKLSLAALMTTNAETIFQQAKYKP